MALILTKEQEAALVKLADREIASAPLKDALEVAEAELADVEQRFYTDQAVVQAHEAEAVNAVIISYQPERTAKRAALDAAKAALESVAAADAVAKEG